MAAGLVDLIRLVADLEASGVAELHYTSDPPALRVLLVSQQPAAVPGGRLEETVERPILPDGVEGRRSG